MVALPGQLFYSTQIPACLWFVTRSKAKNGRRGREGEILFIDARKMGLMADRTHKELTDEDVQLISDTYHSWRGDGEGTYEDVAGFCKSATLEEVSGHDFVLTPGRYVGAPPAEDDGEPFGEKMERLTKELEGQFVESARLEGEIRKNLKKIGFLGA
jgi:type I restriction enzyme M protein